MQPLSLLVVGSDPFTCTQLALKLGELNTTVTLADQVAEALHFLASGQYDGLIASLPLADEDNGAFIRRAKQASPLVEVVIVTAHPSIAGAVAAMRAGATDYLPYPVDPDTLVATLTTITTRKKKLADPAKVHCTSHQDLMIRLMGLLEDTACAPHECLEQVRHLLFASAIEKTPLPRQPEDARFEDLLAIAARLRGPDGCPWDIKQTPVSLKKYLTEECQELLEAIDTGEHQAICEELGDVCFILTMLITMHTEALHFGARDVFAGIIAKMIRRHPHVFGNVTVSGEEALRAQWQQIKASEKQARKA